MAEFFKTILQVLLAVFLVPVVIGVTDSFYRELLKLGQLHDLFAWGVGTYLIFHIFVFVPVGMYQFGKNAIGGLFKFNEVTAVLMPYVMPLYLLILVVAFWSAKLFLEVRGLEVYFMFFLGFFLAAHLALSAHDLKEQNKEGVQSGYFFQLTIVYVFSMLLAALILHLSFKFSFPQFFDQFTRLAWKIYTSVFEQLFW